MINFISNLGYVVVYIARSMLVMEISIGYGVIVAFIIYIKRFNQPVAEIANIIARTQSVVSALEKVFEVLSVNEMETSLPMRGIRRSSGHVESGTSASGTRRKGTSSTDSISTSSPYKVAVVGLTGADKITLASLLVRFYDLDSREILIDGVPTASMSRAHIRDQFLVLQDSWISDGTHYDNVSFTSGTGGEAVESVCDLVGIGKYISSLLDGYDTVVDEDSGMSADWKQQLAIAKTIVKGAPMIIFNEATSSVDTRTERRIRKAIGHAYGWKNGIRHSAQTLHHRER